MNSAPLFNKQDFLANAALASEENVLHRIVRDKADWVEQQQQQRPLSQFMPQVVPTTRDFYGALTTEQTFFILECKKASPSKGLIRQVFNPVEIAQSYRPYASAISVLTDERYFQGDFAYLKQVSDTVTQPVLCKDFIISDYQLYLARYYQADAVLLMLSVLSDKQYQHLVTIAHQLKMGVLTEASNEEEIIRAIQLKAKVVGINNRDLRDLSIDLNRTRTLAPYLPQDVTVISESGIYHYRQVRELSQFVQGFLIGSALMEQSDLTLAVRQVILGDNKVCGLTRPDDAKSAYQAGAVYGGLIFVESSPRYIEPSQAHSIIAAAALRYVGVFRNAPIDNVCQIVQQLSLYAIQLHGNEDQHYIHTLRQKLPVQCQIWYALSITTHTPRCSLSDVDRYLFDNGQGGSGQSFNWSLLTLNTQKKALDNVLLAGGLNADNAAEAAKLGVMGLDFNSGVESEPGKKSAEKLQSAFHTLRNY